MSNAYVALKRLLPPSSLLVGKVTAHHTDDETSTVVLPTQQGVNEYAAGVATGSTIRARGTFVPVGANAFVRDGVIESRAPDENASEIVIGAVVPVPMPLTFSGPIPDQTANVGAAVAVDLTGYWSGGTPPLAYALGAGTLPAGMTVGSGGTLGGTPSAAGLSSGLVVRATDRTGLGADSNAFALTAASGDILHDTFTQGTATALSLHIPETGGAWTKVSGSDIVVQAGTAGLPDDSGGATSKTALYQSSAAPANQFSDTYVECQFTRASVDATKVVSLRVNTSMGGAAGYVHVLIYGGVGSGLLADVGVFSPAFTSLLSFVDVKPNGYVIGALTTIRLERRDNGRDLRFLVDGALIASSGAMPTNRFAGVQLGLSFNPGASESFRINYLRAGPL